MNYFYIFWGLLALFAVGSWANYLIPKFTKRTIPGWVKPAWITAFLAYVGWFSDWYTDQVGIGFKYLNDLINFVARM